MQASIAQFDVIPSYLSPEEEQEVMIEVRRKKTYEDLTSADIKNILADAGLDCDCPASPNMVDHPEHYNAHPSGVECIRIAEHYNFCIGNAIKYLWRAGLKGTSEKEKEDCEKAIWYIQRHIDEKFK